MVNTCTQVFIHLSDSLLKDKFLEMEWLGQRLSTFLRLLINLPNFCEQFDCFAVTKRIQWAYCNHSFYS